MDNFTIPENFYFHGTCETDRFVYIQTPLLLVKDAVFASLSDGAKIMYSLLLNRVGLSISNNMIDEQGRTYILYSEQELSADLGKSSRQITRYYKELESCYLIERKRLLNQKWRIYVLNFQSIYEFLLLQKEPESLENQEETVMSTRTGQKCLVQLDKNVYSARTKMSSPTRQKCPLYIDNYYIENYSIENHSFSLQSGEGKRESDTGENWVKEKYEDMADGVLYSVSQLEDFFPYDNMRELLDYPHFVTECEYFNLNPDQRKDRALEELKWLIGYDALDDKNIADTLLDYMTDIVSLGETITISGIKYPTEVLGRRFFSLDMFSFSHAVNYISEFSKEHRIQKPKNFYVATLLQAKSNMDASISSQVNYDMAHWNVQKKT